MRKVLLAALVVLLGAAGLAWLSLDSDMRALLLALPTNRDVLFWSPAQRDAAFRTMDRVPLLAKVHVVPTGPVVRPLPEGAPLKLGVDVDAYMREQHAAALVIVQGGKLRLERYALGFSAKGRWTSFSVAKSLTSTLLGAALQDGAIKSLDDKVSTYLPEMKGSAYDDVTLEQLLTMTSGVRWNEDYEDPKSDVAQFDKHTPEPGVDATVSYMRTLPREAPAGSKWVYKTGETNLVGVVVSRATGKPLAQYLSEKIWVPFGMEQSATWVLDRSGHEIGGCCLQAATRDFARFGLFVLAGGKADGKPVVPDGWFSKATTKRADIGQPGRGYGYQWWTFDDGSVAAKGIFGQSIFIDPKRQLVIAANGNWATALSPAQDRAREAFWHSVQKAVDEEK